MKSKSDNMGKAIYFYVVMGLYAGLILISRLHWFQKNLEEIADHFEDNLGNLYNTMATGVLDGFITLVIKFLHFMVAKSLQFRYLAALQPVPTMSLLFWVAFTLSISSMQDNIV